MMSPDPYLMGGTQGYNRYSYCLNNPLKYTDPSGEIALVDDAILGVIGGVINWASNGAEFSLRGLGFFGVGFVAGFVSEYVTPVGSAAIMGAGNAALGGYYKNGKVDAVEVAGGAVTSATLSGFTMGIGSVLTPYFSGLYGGLSPMLSGALTQGTVGLLGGGAIGGLSSLANGGSFWDGATTGATWGLGIGLASGAYSGYQTAKAMDRNPWNGKPNTVIEPLPTRDVQEIDLSGRQVFEIESKNIEWSDKVLRQQNDAFHSIEKANLPDKIYAKPFQNKLPPNGDGNIYLKWEGPNMNYQPGKNIYNGNWEIIMYKDARGANHIFYRAK